MNETICDRSGEKDFTAVVACAAGDRSEVDKGTSEKAVERLIKAHTKTTMDNRAPYPFSNPLYWAAFTTIGL